MSIFSKHIQNNGYLCKGNPICINGQSVDKAVKELNYGFSKISDNGCELIAVYNALALIGKKHEFSKILYTAKKLHWVKWLFGLFGSRPWKLYKLFLLLYMMHYLAKYNSIL